MTRRTGVAALAAILAIVLSVLPYAYAGFGSGLHGGGVAAGGGTESFTGSKTNQNFGSIAAGECTAAVTATVTGAIAPANSNATPQPVCAIGMGADNMGLFQGLHCVCWVTGNDEVSFKCCNTSADAFDPNFNYYSFRVWNAE